MNIIKVIEILPQDVFLRSATLFTTAFSEEIIGLSSCNRINLKCNISYLLKKDNFNIETNSELYTIVDNIRDFKNICLKNYYIIKIDSEFFYDGLDIVDDIKLQKIERKLGIRQIDRVQVIYDLDYILDTNEYVKIVEQDLYYPISVYENEVSHPYYIYEIRKGDNYLDYYDDVLWRYFSKNQPKYELIVNRIDLEIGENPLEKIK